MTQLKTKQVAIQDLKPAQYNPRHWDSKSIDDLKNSIVQNGFVVPILANSNKSRYGVVIAGHFRLKVAKELDYKTVPVNFINIKSIDKEKKLNLTLNRVSGDWDYELLKNFDTEILLSAGFDADDLSHIWDEQLSLEDDQFDLKQALSKIKNPKTKPGDVYQLGKHRLICGDATHPNTLNNLFINNEKASVLYFDPPYNINFDYENGLTAKNKYGVKVNDNKNFADYKDFLIKSICHGIKHTCASAHVFTWCDQKYIGLLQEIYKELGINHKRVCLWIKNNQNLTPQIAFNKFYEPCVYGTIGNPYLSNTKSLNEILNKEIGTGNQVFDDIQDIIDIWLAKRKAGQEYVHPTEKPVTLHEKPFKRCTKAGDIILDSFGGSGSTLIACEQLNRKAYLIEISPVFCDVIVNRYEELTQRKAILCK